MKTRLFKCNKCEMTFTTEIRLQRHLYKSTSSKKRTLQTKMVLGELVNEN